MAAGEAVDVEEIAENITGWIKEDYVIVAPIDDSIKRNYTIYSLYSHVNPTESSFAYIPAPTVKRINAEAVMTTTLNVLKKVSGRSKHFPRLKNHGLIKKLVFGNDGGIECEDERDPEWTTRPYIIINHEHIVLSSLMPLSETGCLPVDLALHAGLGMAYCLAALHRADFISRYVTPHSFSYPVPLTLDLLSSRMILTDMSLCLEYPYKNGPRVNVPFTGSLRYSSIRTHQEREQGPADDYISLIFIICEMINGKLPWRSIYEKKLIMEKKMEYPTTEAFKRLPHELRRCYQDLIKLGIAWPSPETLVIDAIKLAIQRRDPNKNYELPRWLVMPSAN
jgi:hypothetical protein